jgi:hypothetical protein
LAILDSVVVGPLLAGSTYVYSFADKGAVPDLVLPLSTTPITVASATTSQVAFRNDGSGTETATFALVWFYEAASRKQPFTTLGWVGRP